MYLQLVPNNNNRITLFQIKCESPIGCKGLKKTLNLVLNLNDKSLKDSVKMFVDAFEFDCQGDKNL